MDHPYIIAATNAAKKLRLPDGWSVKVVTLDDDTEDSFYRNERAGISMWDHPLLRQCLASVLIDESWDSHAKTVLEGDTSADSPERTKSNLKRYADESAEMQRSYEKFKESQRMNKETASRNIGFKKTNYLKDGHEDALDKSFLGNRASEVVRDYDKSLSPRGIDAKSDGEQSIANRSDRKVSFDEHFQNHENMRDGQDSEQDENQEKDQQTFGPTINIEEQTSSRLHSPSHELDSQSRDSKVSRESKDSIGDTGTDSHSYSANSPTHRFSADPIKEIPQSFDTGIQPGNYLSNHAELWNRYRVEADKSVQEDTEKTRSFGGSTVPPQSVAGVHVLTEDAKLANERVHELVIQLRAKIASAEGMDCRVMQNDETAIVSVNGPEDFDAMNISTDQLGSKKTVQDLTVLGADIMSELRHHPEYIIS
ncbi:MAG: hypothetical protein VXZ58_09075, partial [Actinomycetota bacterium]|nr:hypothetical protein [Actinomycetota bacterium]